MQTRWQHNLYSTGRLWQRVVLFFKQRPLLVWSLLGLILISFFATGLRIARTPDQSVMQEMFRRSLSDFEDYHEASGRFFNKAEDPYRVDNLKRARECFYNVVPDCSPLEAIQLIQRTGTYLYPPLLAFILTPLALLEYNMAAYIFHFLSWLMLLMFIWSLIRFMQTNTNDGPSAVELDHIQSRFWYDARIGLPLLISCVLLFQLLSDNAARGNIGYILIFLCGQGLLWSFSPGVWRGLVGGFLLGLAAVIKVTPGLLGFVLVGGRRPLALIGMLLGTLTGFLLPGVLYGHEQNIIFLNDWNRLLIQNFGELTFIRGWVNNQSVVGMIGKLFIPDQTSEQGQFGLPWILFKTTSPEAYQAVFATATRLINMTLLIVLALASLRLALSGGLAHALQMALDFRPAQSLNHNLMQPGLIGLLVLSQLVSLLISGVSWYHAYCVLLIPVALYFWQKQHKPDLWSAAETKGPLLDPAARPMRLLVGVSVVFGVAYIFFPAVLRDFLSVYSIFAACMLTTSLWLGLALMWPGARTVKHGGGSH